MRIPHALQKGDEIRLLAPSRWVEEELIQSATKSLEARGYRCSRGLHLLSHDGQLAGTDEERIADFLDAWHNPDVKAVWALRGGYGAQRIVDALSVNMDDSVSKWYVGFSDSTAIHGVLSNKGLVSLHAAMWSTMSNTLPSHVEATYEVLEGAFNPISFDTHPLDIAGNGRGILVGGNLSVLQTMIGTGSFPVRGGTILFIEDIDEMMYHLDRMLVQLSRASMLKGLVGIVVGEMSDMRDNTIAHGFSKNNPFGRSVESILSEHFSKLGVPVAYSFPAGHGVNNYPIMLGADTELIVSSKGNTLLYQ